MIRRPGVLADHSFVRPGDRPSGPGLDVAEANVAAWGGDLPVYRSCLAAALRAVTGDGRGQDEPAGSGAAGGPSGRGTPGGRRPEARVVRGLAAVAAWRAGVVELREDVLGRAPGLPVAGVAGALGTSAERVGAFLAAQERDPFARPEGVVEVLHRVGGFAGLGGPWVAPPVAAESAGAGRFSVRTADGALWTVVADAWGARLRPGAAEGRGGTGVRAVVAPDSYLVELRR